MNVKAAREGGPPRAKHYGMREPKGFFKYIKIVWPYILIKRMLIVKPNNTISFKTSFIWTFIRKHDSK